MHALHTACLSACFLHDASQSLATAAVTFASAGFQFLYGTGPATNLVVARARIHTAR